MNTAKSSTSSAWISAEFTQIFLLIQFLTQVMTKITAHQWNCQSQHGWKTKEKTLKPLHKDKLQWTWTLLIEQKHLPPFPWNPSRTQPVLHHPSAPVKDIPKHVQPPNQGSVCRERFLSVLKKLRTFYSISIKSSVLGTKRYRSPGKCFPFLSPYLHRANLCLQPLKQPQQHRTPSETSGDTTTPDNS